MGKVSSKTEGTKIVQNEHEMQRKMQKIGACVDFCVRKEKHRTLTQGKGFAAG